MIKKLSEIQKSILLDATEHRILVLNGNIIKEFDLDSLNCNKIYHLPFIVKYFPLYFEIVRKKINFTELLECKCYQDGIIFHLLGKIFIKSFKDRTKLLFQNDSFGFMKGRGVLPNGLLVDKSHVYLGEYFKNSKRRQVYLYQYSIEKNKLKKIAIPWKTRHIHFIQKDPYSEKIYVGTGDMDNESKIAIFNPTNNTFDIIGENNQIWRAVSIIFTPNEIFWGTDGLISENNSAIVCLKREQSFPIIIEKFNSTFFYSSQNKKWIFFGKSNEYSDNIELLALNKESWKIFTIFIKEKVNLGKYENIRFYSTDDKLFVTTLKNRNNNPVTEIFSIKEVSSV
jgi:hypothetical protein